VVKAGGEVCISMVYFICFIIERILDFSKALKGRTYISLKNMGFKPRRDTPFQIIPVFITVSETLDYQALNSS